MKEETEMPGTRKLGKTTDQRRAMLRQQVTDFLDKGKMETTITRAKEIYRILMQNGFAANNVSLGVGSFSMQCLEGEDGTLYPFTRDTFGIAVKSTYCEVDGKPYQIFKDPKTDSGHFKKSQRGMCRVCHDIDGELICIDGLTPQDCDEGESLLQTVFQNGKILRTQSLHEIRQRLHDGRF